MLSEDCRWTSRPRIWQLRPRFFPVFLNRPILPSTVIFGEVGLGGEVRPAMFPEIRLKEASLLGFNRGVIPMQPLGEELQFSMETSRFGISTGARRFLDAALAGSCKLRAVKSEF